MNRTAKILPMAMWLCMAACAPAWAQVDVEASQRLFAAPVTISANGEATVGDLSGVSGTIEQAVRAQLATLRFVPARRDGVAMPSEGYLRGSAVLTPVAGGTFEMHLQGLALAPRQELDMPAPTYPMAHARAGVAGAVEMAVRVGADGRVRDMRTISSSDAAFEAAVRRAARGWRFKPVAGAEDAQVTIPVIFHAGDEPNLPSFECTLDPQRAHFAGQSGCLDPLEVTAGRR